MQASNLSRMVTLGFLAYFGWTGSAPAISEFDFVREYAERVRPFFDERAPAQFYPSPRGGKIHYRTLLQDEPSPLLVIIPGRSEPAVKYEELAFDFFQLGYSSVILDHRGQGASSRLIDPPQKGYIDHYNTYIQDLADFMDDVVAPLPKTRTLAISHSMGSNILSLYLANHDHSFDRVVLSSPMIDIDTRPYPEWFAARIAWIYCQLGLDKMYVWGAGPPVFGELYLGSHSHSLVRKEHRLYWENRHPEQILGGATFGWLNASFASTQRMRREAHQIEIPVLMFQAGQDGVVLPQGQTKVCDAIRNCQLIEFPEAYHEILQERDNIRDRAIALSDSFFRHETIETAEGKK